MPKLSFEHFLLRTLAENVPHLVYAKDTECRLVFANKAVAFVMGAREPAALIGKTDFGFYPEEAAAQYFADEKEIMRTGVSMLNKEQHVHYELTNKDAWLLTTKVPLRDESGQVIGIAGINFNITDRKADEEALRDAKLQAERADRAKSDFLARLSHELRTPLNAVLGYAQDLQRDHGLSEQQKSKLKTIEHGGEQLLLLVNDLFSMATIEAGKLRFLPEDVNLPELMGIVGDVIRVRLATKKLCFTCELDPTLPPVVVADGRRLSQILLSLLGNAANFTDASEISLRVFSVGVTPLQARIRFEVENKGVGLRGDELQEMLQSFEERGDSRTPAKDTGLGLALSRELVEGMGGSLAVQSQPGFGSLFSFELVFPMSALSAELLAPKRPRAADVVLPDEEIEEFVVLARTGNMRNIASFATRVLTLGEQYRGLAEHLTSLVNRFETKEILQLALTMQLKAARR